MLVICAHETWFSYKENFSRVWSMVCREYYVCFWVHVSGPVLYHTYLIQYSTIRKFIYRYFATCLILIKNQSTVSTFWHGQCSQWFDRTIMRRLRVNQHFKYIRLDSGKKTTLFFHKNFFKSCLKLMELRTAVHVFLNLEFQWKATIKNNLIHTSK